MFLKLTKPDNSPIWINAAFVVTVEPRRGGGATVVPIGDGLDYDVRESPEAVLAMLAGEPAPAVVPVPVPKSLAPLPHYVQKICSHDSDDAKDDAPPAELATAEPATAESAPAEPAPAEPPKKKTRGRVAKKKSAEAESAAAESAPTETVAAETAAPTETAADEPPAKPKRTRKRKTPIDLTDEQLLRLRRMVPGTVRKLANTLVTQFHVADPELTIRALDEHAIISIDRERIIWSAMQ